MQYMVQFVLGLKGTMSEAELHILRMRLHAGRLNKVQRGGYRQCLPTGLVWLEDDSVVKDPDEQVRSVIELVFTKFEEIGSCRGVARYMRQEKILLPRRHQGMGHGKLRWKVASDHMIWDMLNNPAYAGAFAYGRTQFDPKHRKTGHPSSGRLDKTAKEWTCLHKGAYPAYITWEQYESNQERIRNNGSRVVEAKLKAVGAIREGAGLLQGLVTCGQCGRRMTTVYKPHPKYCCQALGRSGEPLCSYIPATAIDDVVVAAYFQAIRPAELNALEAVLKAQQAERDRLIKHWEQQLKRAKYEADLAERQYDAVDATHRLVALTLEQRWEEKLNQLRTTQEDYERFMNTPLQQMHTPEQCEQFRNISEALPTLWRANQLTHTHQKELLRALIARVNLKRVAPDQIEVNIIWVSGHYTLLQTTVPIHRNEKVTGMSTSSLPRTSVLSCF